MNILFPTIIAILLASCLSAAPLNVTEAFTENSTNLTTTYFTSNTPTTVPITTARATTAQQTTGFTQTTAPFTSNITTSVPVTTAFTSTTTRTVAPTTKSTGRKFDGLSFIGGMILAAGLTGLIFLVVSYLRRSNRLPYSNLT